MTFETWHLTTTHLGRETRVYDSLDSTNTLALSLAGDTSNAGLVLIARNQTAGRGQYGRQWQAPPASSVLMSALVFPPAELCRPVLLTAWAAVAVCEVVKALTGKTPRIKWPNDILLLNKKVCGILIEQRTTSSNQIATAVGIGLNVTQPKEWFEAAGLLEATSLACVAPLQEYEAVARQLITTLDAEWGDLGDGRLEKLEARWRDYLALADRNATAEFHDGDVVSGCLLELSFDGLVLRVDGNERRIPPERIKHLRAI